MKTYIYITILTGISFLYSCTSQSRLDEREIRETLEIQADCWSNGDLECFMKGYWDSDSLLFVSKNGITKGWNKTYKNYQKKYPSKEAMGELTFKIHKINIEGNSAFTVGEWKVIQENTNVLSGYFTLYWKQINGKWKIIADHTS